MGYFKPTLNPLTLLLLCSVPFANSVSCLHKPIALVWARCVRFAPLTTSYSYRRSRERINHKRSLLKETPNLRNSTRIVRSSTGLLALNAYTYAGAHDERRVNESFQTTPRTGRGAVVGPTLKGASRPTTEGGQPACWYPLGVHVLLKERLIDTFPALPISSCLLLPGFIEPRWCYTLVLNGTFSNSIPGCDLPNRAPLPAHGTNKASRCWQKSRLFSTGG